MKLNLKKLFPAIIGIILIFYFFSANFFQNKININTTVGTNDLTDLYIPFFKTISDSYSRFELPLWEPEISSGYPLLAGAVGTLYPINILLSFTSTLTTFKLTIFVTYFLLFLASFLYLRKIKLEYLPSIFGSLIITFSGFAVTEITHFDVVVSFYLLIFQLWLYEHYQLTYKFYLIIFMGFLMGMSILGGHPQTNLYALIFLIPYWFIRGRFIKKNKLNYLKLFKHFIFAGFIYALIAVSLGAAQLLPMAEFTSLSNRSTGLNYQILNRFNFPLKDIITFVFPFANYENSHTIDSFYNNGWPADERYLYISKLGLIFALFGLIKTKSDSLYFRKLYSIILVLAIIFMFGTQLTIGKFLEIPPFSFFRGSFRMSMVATLALGVLAAFSYQDFYNKLTQKYSKTKILFITLSIVALIMIDLKFNAQKLHYPYSSEKLYKTPEAVLYIKDKLINEERLTSQQYFYPTIKIYLTNPNLWNNYDIHANLRNLIPIFNNLLWDIPKNIGASNSAGLKISEYNELEQEIYFNGINYANLDTPTVTKSWIFLNRLMGVRYFLSAMPIESYILSTVKKIDFETGQDPVYIYEFTDYYPRTFMVPKSENASSEDIKTHLIKADFDPKQTIYIEEESDWAAAGGFASTAIFEKYENQEVVINTESSADGWLFLSDAYYPGWVAYVDGTETKIYRANYAFRAVQVPSGAHQIIFRFKPQSFYLGLKISLLTLVFSVVYFLFLILKSFILFPKSKKSVSKKNYNSKKR